MKRMFKTFIGLLLIMAFLLTPYLSTIVSAAGGITKDKTYEQEKVAASTLQNHTESDRYDTSQYDLRYVPAQYSAANIEEGIYYIKNLDSEQYIDIHGPYTDMIHQWIYHSDLQENWLIEKQNNGTYTIKSLFSGKYIGIENATTGIANVNQYNDINDHTKWYIYQDNSKNTLFVPKLNSNLLLCSPDSILGSELQLSESSSDSVKWQLILQKQPYHTVNEDGEEEYHMIKNIATRRFACPYGPYIDSGTRIHQWDFINTLAMHWIIEESSNTFYTIKNRYTEKYIGYAEDENGIVFIEQYSSNTDDCVQWKFYLSSSGHLIFTPKGYEPLKYALSVDPPYDGHGSYLKLVEYSDDDNYKDEWELFTWIGTYLGEVDNDLWYSDYLHVGYWDSAIKTSYSNLNTGDNNDIYFSDALEVAENQWYGTTYIPISSNYFFPDLKIYAGLESQIQSKCSGFQENYLGLTQSSAEFEGMIRMGNTNELRYLRKMVSVTVYIETGRISPESGNTEYYSREQVYCIASHELGHAMGYFGHAPTQENVMFHSYGNQSVYLLQPNEFNHIFYIYKKFTR